MNILLDLFLTFAKIGLFTFGGGYAMISMIENNCVERKQWITHDEMMNVTVIAESTPGPIAINCATFTGYKKAGTIGALVATLGIVVPSFAVIYLISMFLDNFLELTIIANAFKGIKIAVGILILDIPLNKNDIESLESILWSEIGSKEEYEAEYGKKPLGQFVREIVGLDMNAAKEAFSEYLDEAKLDSRQIYFINQIVEYIVQNGMLTDMSVLQEAPFTDKGSIVEVFDDLSVWMGIKRVIDSINGNAKAS